MSKIDIKPRLQKHIKFSRNYITSSQKKKGILLSKSVSKISKINRVDMTMQNQPYTVKLTALEGLNKSV